MFFYLIKFRKFILNIELPLSPENVQVNQTLDGVLVKWTYPNSTPIRIEYFQIYYRELNERLTNMVVVGSSYFNYEWKTTEPINSNENSYLIEDADLVENQSYEIQLVSFSLYSKSLPSQTFKLKYQPRISSNPSHFLFVFAFLFINQIIFISIHKRSRQSTGPNVELESSGHALPCPISAKSFVKPVPIGHRTHRCIFHTFVCPCRLHHSLRGLPTIREKVSQS